MSRIGEIESENAIKERVKLLPVLSLLPGWAVVAEIKTRIFIVLPQGRKPFERTWGTIHSRARPLNHAETTFLNFAGSKSQNWVSLPT